MSDRLRILGVDPGSRIVGYGVIDVTNAVRAAGRFEYVECGTLRVDGRRNLNLRLEELARGLAEITRDLEPTIMAIETAFSGRSVRSALTLAEARGALKLVGLQAGLSVHEYAPARIKKSVAGNGRATKMEVQARVTLLCKLGRRPVSDAADALAVALCHAHSGTRGTRGR